MATKKATGGLKKAKKATAKKTTKKTAKKAAKKKPAAKKAAKKTTKKKVTKKPAATKKTAKKASKADTKKTTGKKTSSSRSSSTTSSRETRQERVFTNLKRDFGKARDTIATEFDRAVDAAKKKLPKQGIDDEKLKKVGVEFKERMSSVGEHLKGARKKVSDASERLHVEERARSVADSSLSALHGLAVSLRGLAERLEESLEERKPLFTGEEVEPGRYLCRECETAVEITARGALAACSKCGGKKFRHT